MDPERGHSAVGPREHGELSDGRARAALVVAAVLGVVTVAGNQVDRPRRETLDVGL
ncbi:hypothetical protein ACG2OD_00200 [Streptomyces sp. PDY-4]|uniref:hypothetical protein n=1 Tax=Streptomyces sp. PDY-4 TaxID=3376070 RepID=UPI0037B9AF29